MLLLLLLLLLRRRPGARRVRACSAAYFVRARGQSVPLWLCHGIRILHAQTGTNGPKVSGSTEKKVGETHEVAEPDLDLAAAHEAVLTTRRGGPHRDENFGRLAGAPHERVAVHWKQRLSF